MADNEPPKHHEKPGHLNPFVVRVTRRFIILSLVSCILLAFAVGRTARIILIINPQKELLRQQAILANANKMHNSPLRMELPTPILRDGKEVPHTTYSSKNFDTSRALSINSRWVVTDVGQEQCVDQPANGQCEPVKKTIQPTNISEEEHFPEGEHLLIDIANVDPGFLNSENRLAQAMIDLVDQCGLTLLSYHCHSLIPIGVSCAGVLLESHVSFHTWPAEGVITLDLFTCGDSQLLPVVPIVEKLFAVPSANTPEKPQMIWAHKYRGFSETSDEDAAELTDFFTFPIGAMTDYKKEIISSHTDFQRVDIYDVLRPHFQSLSGYKKSLDEDGSYESLHPEFFSPDRIVFLDGILQSRRSGDAPYHEALVHPAMFAHSNPKRVAIIGGGEGATLREVLKHNTVEKLVMVEIDEKMVNLSRKYLPDWSDCSRLEGGTRDCFEDPRVSLYCEDAFKWFIDRFANDTDVEEPFDVIIMDALDPQIQKDFVEALYDGGPFLKSLPNALSPNGVFVGQVGQAPALKDPLEDHSLNRNRVKFIQSLINLGFKSVLDYEEARGGFELPWQYVVAFKTFDSRADWFVSEAAINLKVRNRAIRAVDGASPFLYFDGATMLSYMYPSKASEVVFCRGKWIPEVCNQMHGFDPERKNIPLSDALEVRPSTLGEKAGHGVFAKMDIPHYSYAGLDMLIESVYLSPASLKLINEMDNHWTSELWIAAVLESYAHGYGHFFSKHGRTDVFVDSTLHSFINHGCKGTNNVGYDYLVTEATADPDIISPEVLYQYFGKENVYNPFAERQTHFFSSATPLREIKAGEELFNNYLGMTGNNQAGWTEDVHLLKNYCSEDESIQA